MISMTPLAQDLNRISNMSHYDLAKLWRFGGSDHPYIQDPALFEAVKDRLYNHFGGITPSISKQVGWDE
jgi:hypothetical protein